MMRNLYRLNRKQWDARSMMQFDTAIELGILTPVESTKMERKLRDALNRILKLVPSVRRISELDRIAVELVAETCRIRRFGDPHASADGLEVDALALQRLEYDLTSMREVKASITPKPERTMRAGSKYEPSQWPRGPRP